jgi:2-oxoglutarate dehydrogenase E2 component (dihydrolipoamide succinyltransferase)
MSVDVKVPEVGESITEGVILQWFKQTGEVVQIDDELFELETDKITATVLAETAGTLTVLKQVDDTVEVGEVVASIDPAGAQAAAAPAQTAAAPAAAPAAEANPLAQAGDAILSPAARHMVLQHNIDISKLNGTGKDGRITKEDVQRFLDAPPAPAPAPAKTPAPAPKAAPVVPAGERETRKAMSPIRKRIAQRLLEAQQNAAILTTFNEVDLTNIMAFRKKYQEQFVARYGLKLGFMSIFVKAAVIALKEVPEINAYIDGDDIVYNHFYDVGIAVGTDRGLVVPIVRNADQLSFAGVEQEISNLAKKARKRKLTLDDMTGGSFTISNGGVYGSLLSTPILNPPQSGILGMHGIKKRPMFVDGEIKVRPMMYLALSYDHRIVDGKGAVTFLKRIVECVENPERLLFEV